MRSVREEHRILHHQHRSTVPGHTLDGRIDMRLENARRARLRVVKKPIRRLRARPAAARFVDRRGRRSGQLFRGFEQATVQAFVAQIGVGKLPSHPLDRLCAGLHDSLHLSIFASRRLSQSVRHCSSPIATLARLPNAALCVQRFRSGHQIRRANLNRCV